ncbi:MAG: ABC transporter permease, partial [Vulcanimicrobiaceae bacterium]
TYKSPSIDVEGVGGRYTTVESANFARGVATFLVMLLYIVVLINSQMLTSSVAEEKTSRIAELLVAAVPPSALLAGKVLATGASGILQLAVWSAAGFALVGRGGDAHQAASETVLEILGALTPPIVVAFIGFFIIGFLQYSLLFASVASLITRTEELGSVTFPLALPAIAALLIAQFGTDVPNAPPVVITSFVPLLSPFVMFVRMLMSDVPAWQVALSFALNIAVLAAIVPLAGKLYRIGLLLYGRAPKLTQIWTVLKS